MKIKKALRMLSALAQESRLNVYRLLIQEGPQGLSAGSIAEILQVPPATLSFHLSQLEGAGLLRSVKHGRTVMYSARYKAAKRLIRFITEGSYKDKEKRGLGLAAASASATEDSGESGDDLMHTGLSDDIERFAALEEEDEEEKDRI